MTVTFAFSKMGRGGGREKDYSEGTFDDRHAIGGDGFYQLDGEGWKERMVSLQLRE